MQSNLSHPMAVFTLKTALGSLSPKMCGLRIVLQREGLPTTKFPSVPTEFLAPGEGGCLPRRTCNPSSASPQTILSPSSGRQREASCSGQQAGSEHLCPVEVGKNKALCCF